MISFMLKDVVEYPRTTTVSLTMTVIDIDDETPKFIDLSSDCTRKCKDCFVKSFIGNVSYENKVNETNRMS